MAVLLIFLAEGRAHADPIVAFAVHHHVAETVVGCAIEFAVVAALLEGLVENLLQVGHMLQVHRHLGQILVALRATLITQRTNALDGIGIAGRGFAESRGIAGQLGETGCGRLHGVGCHHAGVGITTTRV